MTETYGPSEVAKAIGIKHGTLHSWLARRYVEIESLGPGVERRLTFEQVLELGVIAELQRLGISIGVAARTVRDSGVILTSDHAKAMVDRDGLSERLRKALADA